MAWLAAALLAPAAIGCGGSGGGRTDGPVTVYVSLPLTGPRAADGRNAADGARLALEEADGRAAELEVRAEYLDDARGEPWDPVAVGENARTAAQDSSTAGYIGELDSQPTRTSLPITNQAGIAQVSPAAGGVDLTRPAKGYPDSPDRYQPSGEASFARVIPDDAAVAAAAAELASESGARRVAAARPRSSYEELSVAEFERAAGEAGLEVVARSDRAEVVFEPERDGEASLTAPRRRLAPALDPANLADAGFAGRFEQRFARAPGPLAAYGYEAMALLLAAIEGARRDGGDFRASVADELLGADRPESVLGRYSITDDGDTTLCAIQPYGPGDRPAEPICPGS